MFDNNFEANTLLMHAMTSSINGEQLGPDDNEPWSTTLLYALAVWFAMMAGIGGTILAVALLYFTQ